MVLIDLRLRTLDNSEGAMNIKRTNEANDAVDGGDFGRLRAAKTAMMQASSRHLAGTANW
jgi:hypothetical protein